MKYSCTCCSIPKEYTELRNLYRHQRSYDPDFIEPAVRLKLRYDQSPRHCLSCGTKLDYDAIASGTQENFCSRRCSASYNNTKRFEAKQINSSRDPLRRKCLHCSNTTARNTPYCSSVCSMQHRKKLNIVEWLAGNSCGDLRNGDLAEWARNYLLEQADHKCTRCGWGEIHPITGKVPLTVDHIDGDSTNNSPDNLKVLCPNCHSLTPTYGALNKGNGREHRRTYRQTMKASGRQVA